MEPVRDTPLPDTEQWKAIIAEPVDPMAFKLRHWHLPGCGFDGVNPHTCVRRVEPRPVLWRRVLMALTARVSRYADRLYDWADRP